MGGSSRVEGWLVGTRVITSSASCGGGGKGDKVGARGAGSRGGPMYGGCVEAGQPEAGVLPT